MSGIRTLFFLLCMCGYCSIGEASKDKTTEYYYGFMELSVPTEDTTTACFIYPFEYYHLSSSPSKSYHLLDYREIDLCNATLDNNTFTISQPKSIFLVTARSNCSVQQSMGYIQESGAGLILLSNFTYIMNQSYGLDMFAVVSDWMKFESLNFTTPTVTVRFFGRGFDFSTLVLWSLAVFCILVGSSTGSPVLSVSGFVSSESPEDGEADKDETATNEEQVHFSMKLILLMVVFITTTLLLLYFFYKYLVYVFIVIFCIASARATYNILQQLFSCCKVELMFCKVRRIGMGEILLGLVSMSVPVVWFVYRHNSIVGSVLQDTLGVFFCVNMIQTLRIPNLKYCTILLLMLFFYDIFFVFITPYFTSNGKSIMGEVARGGSDGGTGGSSEALPLLMQVPQLGRISTVCGSLPSLLGFGDIIVPGLLTGFAHTFDVSSGNKYRPYFISTSIGYVLGLTGAFVALYLTNTGQPALLYIVPATLIMIFSVGLYRKEVRALWKGAPPRV